MRSRRRPRCASSPRSSGASWTSDRCSSSGSVRQRSGKVVQAWAAETDFDPATLRSAEVLLEWPPRSGRRRPFPEVDRAGVGRAGGRTDEAPARAGALRRPPARAARRCGRALGGRAERAGTVLEPDGHEAERDRPARRRARPARARGPGRRRRPAARAGSGAGSPKIACPTRVAWACSARSASRRVRRQPAASSRAPCQSSQRQRRNGRRPGASFVERVAEGQTLDDRHAPQPSAALPSARPRAAPVRGATVGGRGHADALDDRVRAAAARRARRGAAGRRGGARPRRALPPQSRRPGMSKTRLGALLGEHGIAYEHRRALGTPPDLRARYRAGEVEAAAAAYGRHVEAHAPADLDALAAGAVGRRAAHRPAVPRGRARALPPARAGRAPRRARAPPARRRPLIRRRAPRGRGP